MFSSAVGSYEEAKAKGTQNFDRELEDMIERLIVECDRKIQRALKRLADDDAKAAIAIFVSEVTLVSAKTHLYINCKSLFVTATLNLRCILMSLFCKSLSTFTEGTYYIQNRSRRK